MYEAFTRYWVPYSKASFDETSPGFSGRTRVNVITKHKKVPMAVQFWSLCDSSGFQVRMEPVLDSLLHSTDCKKWSATQNAIFRCLGALPTGHKRMVIVFDNLFTKLSLFLEIWERFGHYAVGTWRPNFGVPTMLKRSKIPKPTNTNLNLQRQRKRRNPHWEKLKRQNDPVG